MKTYITLLILFFNVSILPAQNTIHIVVSEESGEPLVGGNIIINETTKGTITNVEGEATLTNIPDGQIEVVVSFIGFEEKKITLTFPQDNNKNIVLELEEDHEELEEVVISTTRSSRTIKDIPTRIEAITSEELGEKAAMNSSNIGMLLSETSGVQMQQTSLSSGNLSIRIQGLDGRYTQILKDGFPLYGGFAGGLSIMQIPPLDLKQVELIKGSNSTLYGGGAIAGLVNLVTIKPGEKPELSTMIDQTTALGTTGNLFYAQRYGETGLSIYASANNQVAYDPDRDGFSNMPKGKTFNLNPKFYYYFNPGTELSIGLNVSMDNRTGGDIEVIKGNITNEHVYSEKNISNRYSTMLHFNTVKENYTFSLKNSVSLFDRNLQIPDYRFSGNQLSSFSELIYHFHRKEKSDWLFGTNLYSESFTEKRDTATTKHEYSFNTIGAFLQNTTSFNPIIAFETGLRVDYDFDYGTFVLPRLSLLLKPHPKLSARFGGALGYKMPTIFTEDAEKLHFRNIEPIDASKINPETSIGGNFDINYKTVFFDKLTFSINQLFFYTQLKNSLVLREKSMQTGYFFENADGDILSSGFETNIKLTYSDFKVYLSYAFINTELRYDNINNQKPLTPKHNAGFVLYYEIEEKWSAGYELYYTGNQFNELYYRKSDYFVMGFMVMRKFEKLSIFVNFENFTNTLQSDYEPLVLPPYDEPVFPDIWAPTNGFVFNTGLKYFIF